MPKLPCLTQSRGDAEKRRWGRNGLFSLFPLRLCVRRPLPNLRVAVVLFALAASLPGPARAQRVGRDSAHAVPLVPITATARKNGLRVTGAFRQAVDSTLLANGRPTRATGRWLS